MFIGWGEGVWVNSRYRQRDNRPSFAFEHVLQ
jgi:hypothetical protein